VEVAHGPSIHPETSKQGRVHHLPTPAAAHGEAGWHVRGYAMISCQLSTIMEARRLSQTRLAQLAGVHRNAIHKLYANNWTSIRRETLDRICTVLQVSVGELLVWHDEQRLG
jgi:putative transcriptional regulator